MQALRRELGSGGEIPQQFITTPETIPSLEEIRRAGFEALRPELGPRGLVLFLQQFIKPSGDYTAERAALQALA